MILSFYGTLVLLFSGAMVLYVYDSLLYGSLVLWFSGSMFFSSLIRSLVLWFFPSMFL